MTLADALRVLHGAGRIRSPWLPGMVARYNLDRPRESQSVIRVSASPDFGWPETFAPHNQWDVPVHFGGPAMHVPSGAEIDASDPATRGCLLALLREAAGDPHAFIGWNDEAEFWFVSTVAPLPAGLPTDGDSDADLLAAALIALAREVTP